MIARKLLELDGISKRFPGVLANDDVSFDVEGGEIHALFGENGAGKSTLVKMIYGVLHPDSGTMRLDGAPYAPSRPSEARGRGVGMVFQHFSLFDGLTVAENIALGVSRDRATGDLARRIGELSGAYGLRLDAHRLVGMLSVGERQRVEIVRCLLQDPRLIIMDEPTSVLTPHEVDLLFQTLRRLAAEGRSILYISHKLDEIRVLCKRATVLRAGKVVATCVPARESARSLAEMMIGTALAAPQRPAAQVGHRRLALNNLSLASERPFGVNLHDISLGVRAGEILGIAGVAGNGQVELMEALTGERVCERADSVVVDGVDVGLFDPARRRALGMCCIPEERLGHAAVPDMSLAENAVLSAGRRKRLSRRGFIDCAAAGAFARQVVEAFNVKTAGIDHAARSLSGGNLQKFIVGREILQEPAVLVASQPTWGVDAGAAASIHALLLGLAAKGAAVLVISQDLDELFAISSRIAVLAHGRLTASRAIDALSVEAIGRDMGGRGAAVADA